MHTRAQHSIHKLSAVYMSAYMVYGARCVPVVSPKALKGLFLYPAEISQGFVVGPSVCRPGGSIADMLIFTCRVPEMLYGF